jgi:uncharacterized protein involved in exopolysaccharide biosynthesis
MANAKLNDVDEPKVHIGALKKYYIKNWYWFLISLIFFLGAGYIFLKVKNPTYAVTGTLMFNQNEDDDAQGGMLGSLMASFSMGGANYVSVDDEVFKIKSHTAIRQMVKDLNLNKCYTNKPGLFKRKIYYFQDSPLDIQIPDEVLDTISAATEFFITTGDNGKDIHLKVKQGIYKTVFSEDIKSFPYTVSTPLGRFTIVTTPYYKAEDDLNFKAVVESADFYASEIAEDIDAFPESKKSNAVIINYEAINTDMGKALINHLIEIYNEGSVADKRAQSEATLNFLNERLVKLYKDLDGSETNIAQYKKNNNIVDPEVEAQYIFSLKQQTNSTLIELESQVAILKMVKEFLDSEQNKYALVPFAGGVKGFEQGSGLVSTIDAYNTLALEHMKIESSAKGNNTSLKQIETQMDAMRKNLVISLDRTLSAAKISAARVSGENGEISSRISTMPKMEQELTNLYRDKEIKNQVYAYLLQKHEETEIKLARVLPAGKIIDAAYVDPEQVSPKKKVMICFFAFLGIFVPAVVLYWRIRKTLTPAEEAEHLAELEEDVNKLS